MATTTTPALVQTSVEDKVGTIAFDNYAKRNALSAQCIDEIMCALDDMEHQGVRAIVLRAAGANKVWSAGHDIDELPVANADPLPYADPIEVLLRRVRSHPAAVVAMVHGSVWGGACDLAMHCDLVIADETCAFAITPARLGLPYSTTGIQYMAARLPLNVVNEMFMTANPISADRALHFSLVNRLVGEDDLEKETYDIAKAIRSRSGEAIAAFKEQLSIVVEAVALNAETAARIQQLRHDAYHGRDYNEGVAAFKEKRHPDFG